MPKYDYRCKECGTTHEIEHGVNAERPTKCPTCGGQLQRVFYPVGVVFKGSGFHKTDYAAKTAQKAGSGEGAPAKSEGGAPAKGDGSTPAAKPSETASAPKTDAKAAPAAPTSKPKPDAKPSGKGS